MSDTAPQPPPTEPCDDCRHEPCVCVQPTPEQAAELLADYQQWLYARGEKDRRIAALEGQLAEAQARLERIHAIVTRLLAEPGNHTEQLVEIATICEARADELEGKS